MQSDSVRTVFCGGGSGRRTQPWLGPVMPVCIGLTGARPALEICGGSQGPRKALASLCVFRPCLLHSPPPHLRPPTALPPNLARFSKFPG